MYLINTAVCNYYQFQLKFENDEIIKLHNVNKI